MGRLFFSVHAPAFSLFPIAYYYLSTRPFGGVSVGQPGIEGVGEFLRPTREARRSNQENRTKPKRNPNQKGENERVGVDQHKTQTQKYNERGLKSGRKNLMRDGGDKSDIQSKTKAKTTKTKLAAI